MTDTYIYLIREKDWDSDNYLPGTTPSTDSHDQVFREHAEFQAAVAALVEWVRRRENTSPTAESFTVAGSTAEVPG